MNKKVFNVSVSVKDNSAKVITGVIQYDTGNLFNVSITDGSRPFDYTGYSNIVIEILKPDGTVFIDGDGGSLDAVDAEMGIVSFILQPQCVLLKGMHFVTMSIYSNGVRVTTARLNYFVSENMDDSYQDEIESQSEYPILQLLIAQASGVMEAEQMRQLAEQLRQAAESGRVDSTSGILAQAQQAIEQAQEYVEKVKNWYDLFMSAAGDVSGVDLSSVITATDLKKALKVIDCGTFDGEVSTTIQALRGSSDNLPTLEDGVFAYAKDKKALYIGADGENVQINKPCFVAQATAPEDRTILWIDTENGNALKFWDGEKWSGTHTAVFA